MRDDWQRDPDDDRDEHEDDYRDRELYRPEPEGHSQKVLESLRKWQDKERRRGHVGKS